LVTRSTACKDRSAANARLAEYERQEERTRAGIVSEAELDTAAHGKVALSAHIEAFKQHLTAKGAS
jgi:hypothetical protein